MGRCCDTEPEVFRRKRCDTTPCRRGWMCPGYWTRRMLMSTKKPGVLRRGRSPVAGCVRQKWLLPVILKLKPWDVH
ncbi:hypothetical protein BRADI_1g32045v3 [Brachypodium distachyon]|uniref:Uncharacterized protein n=1 Tax=Brachypodium distachyon TaxID=15368 RepID=A0A2K2DMB0_BRADI|nr:hypothetical protein BRADI_1g32045v3 [Brachypodium distachyon]